MKTNHLHQNKEISVLRLTKAGNRQSIWCGCWDEGGQWQFEQIEDDG